MADVKISQLSDGSPAQAADEIPVTRGASNYKISAGDIADLVIGSLTASKPVFTDSSGDLTSTGTVPLNQGGTGATTASGARTALELGSIATQAASAVSITGGSIAGITDLAVADGGTGSSTAAGARTNLLPSYSSNSLKVLRVNSGETDVEWSTISTGGVTSITAGTGLSGGTITSTGTIALASAYGDTTNPYAAKTANYVLAAPNGSSGAPTFRALVAADIPTLNQNTTGNAATATALQTARTINGTSFDGTANITITDSTKLALSGGTMTGAITFAAGQAWPTFNQTTTGAAADISGGSANQILYQNGSGSTTFATAPTVTDTYLKWNGTAFAWDSPAGAGSVTSVGLTMPTGFSVANSPITGSGTLAVTTTLNGILKGNGSGFTTATSGTDYAPATSGTSILYGNGSGGFSNVTVGTGLSFSAGTLSATGAGGSGDVVGPSSSTDNQIVLFDSTTGKLIKGATTTGLLKASSGVIAAATSGTDYAPATSGTSILKGSGSGGFSNATAGTDYAAATTGANTELLANNGSGGFANVTVGTGLSLSAGTLTATGGAGSSTAMNYAWFLS